MSKLSIVIPARNELYLNQTIEDIFAKAAGEIEVILVLDDCWNLPLPADRPNMTIVHFGGRRGMRPAINAAAEIGKGEFLLKCDAHVSFCEGFDEILKADCDSDWVVTPRRYSLDIDTWGPTDKRPVDHEYLTYPYDENGNEIGIHGKYWWSERDRAHPEDISENLGWQGSCWMTHMDYFRKLVYPLDDVNYGMFIGEPGEIGFKIWLSGGKNMLNKKVFLLPSLERERIQEVTSGTHRIPIHPRWISRNYQRQ